MTTTCLSPHLDETTPLEWYRSIDRSLQKFDESQQHRRNVSSIIGSHAAGWRRGMHHDLALFSTVNMERKLSAHDRH
jgi:hypothetical protein